MIRRLPSFLAAVVLPSLAAACGGTASSPEPTSTTSDALSAAVPKREWLQLDLSAAQAQDVTAPTHTESVQLKLGPQQVCAGGPPAMFAALTGSIMQGSNGVLDGVLTLLENVTSGPPAEADPDTAVWGPLSSPQSPAIYRVIYTASPPMSSTSSSTALRSRATSPTGRASCRAASSRRRRRTRSATSPWTSASRTRSIPPPIP
jgi:hypothetical protein